MSGNCGKTEYLNILNEALEELEPFVIGQGPCGNHQLCRFLSGVFACLRRGAHWPLQKTTGSVKPRCGAMEGSCRRRRSVIFDLDFSEWKDFARTDEAADDESLAGS